ncbi:hypothetical protein MPSEU_000943700 [Mayamaea pseudoterrestris]|nr:hypothetical protein MPSEU_000943700 [Mayamaea pseudoterrestris]
MIDASGSNPFGGSAHADVLEAQIPADNIGRSVLLNEVKNRAKAAVSASQWFDAQRLYEKAIAICKESDDKAESAICYSNLSLVLGKMQKWSQAKQAAVTATELDSSYTKGYWRLGSACAALKEYDQALNALEIVRMHEPTSKLLAKEIDRIKNDRAKHDEQAQAQASTPSSTSAARPKTTPAPPRSQLPKSSGSSSTTAPAASAAINDETTVEDDHGNIFTKSEVTRGYKIVNGKKTSYFHNELDEQTKQLIGDIAPKKLEHASSSVSVASSDDATMGSAWNQAGTWEERDVSKWACETLQQAMMEAKYEDNEIAATITKAEITGSASVAMVRGKKRYIYELAATIHWSATGSDANATASGSITFPDIDGTCMLGEPYDVAGFNVASNAGLDATALHAKICKSGLRDELHKAIDGWVQLLKETY